MNYEEPVIALEGLIGLASGLKKVQAANQAN